MTAELIGHFPAGSEEWHAARTGVMTGSRIAAVLGLSPWESRFSLWHRMAGLAAAEQENDEMHWGMLIEPVIREEFARRRLADGLSVAITGTWRHAERPWQVVNPDGLIWSPTGTPTGPLALFEAKTARAADGWGEPGTDEIPVYYRAQCLWGLDVLGLEVCHLAVLIAGSDYREYRIEYAPDEAEYMRAEARAFLDSLAAGRRPDIDAHSSTYQVVRELHPDIDDERIDLPAHIDRPYLDALAAFEAAEDEKQRAASAVLDHMGRARRAMWDGQQIAMRVPGRGDNPPYLKQTLPKATGQKVSPAA